MRVICATVRAPGLSDEAAVTVTLVLVRHGSTDATERGAFAGWLDVPLNDHGRFEAREVGRLLAEHRLRPSRGHTSVLSRSVETCSVLLEASGSGPVPVRASWRLNERSYGALQGRPKREVRATYGAERYRQLRRSFRGLPPPMSPKAHNQLQQEYEEHGLPVRVPSSESLAMVYARVAPYWATVIRPELELAGTTLVVAHSNSLRALVMHLEAVSEEAMVDVNIPVAMPLVYEFDAALRPRGPGTYLQPERAVLAAEAVALEGD